jgi:hypothetical protein
MKAKFYDLELVYKLAYDEGTQSAICKPFLKLGESEVPLSEARFGLLLNVKYLGDIAYIGKGDHGEVISLSEVLPKNFGEFKKSPGHAWFIANFLKYEFEKIYGGWEVNEVEYEYKHGESYFDVVSIKPDGRKAILEFKTIYERSGAEDLIKRAGKYIEACIEDQNFEEINFIFQVDQNNEIPQEGMKGLYRALNEFLNTGKLKMPDGTILLDISPDEARKVVKLLTWAGGYIP